MANRGRSKELRKQYQPEKGSKLDLALAAMGPAEEGLAAATSQVAEIERQLRSAQKDASQLAGSTKKDDLRALVETQALIPALEGALRVAKGKETEARDQLRQARIPVNAFLSHYHLATGQLRKAEKKLAGADATLARVNDGERGIAGNVERTVFIARQEVELARWELQYLLKTYGAAEVV
jgi:hypothetical protein